MSEIQRLRDRIEELEDLLGIGRDDLDRYRKALKIRGQLAALLGLIVKKNGTVTRAAALIAIQGIRPDCDELSDPRIVDTLTCHLRKLLPDGVKISTDWGVGYYMDNENKRALARAVAAQGEHGEA